MRGHRFKDWVKLQVLDKPVEDFDGDPAEWSTIWCGRSNIKPTSAGEIIRGQQINEQTTHTVEMRFDPQRPLTSGMRLLIDDESLSDINKRRLSIDSVIDVDERRRYLLLQCIETTRPRVTVPEVILLQDGEALLLQDGEAVLFSDEVYL